MLTLACRSVCRPGRGCAANVPVLCLARCPRCSYRRETHGEQQLGEFEKGSAMRPASRALPTGAAPVAALVLASLLWGTADVQDVRVGGRCFGALTGFLVSGRKP